MAEQISLNLSYDYTNKQYKVGAQWYTDDVPPTQYSPPIANFNEGLNEQLVVDIGNSIATDIPYSTNSIPYTIIDEDGIAVGAGQVAPKGVWTLGNSITTTNPGRSFGAATTPFGYNNQGGYGYINGRLNSPNSLWVTNPFSETDISLHAADPAFAPLLFQSFVVYRSYLPQTQGEFINTPIQVKRGEAGLYASVSAVSGNRITWQNPTVTGTWSNTNWSNALVEVLSGAAAGSTYRVVSANTADKTFDLDSAPSLSGQIIRVLPRTKVIGYSGWSDASLFRAKFTTDTLAYGVGNYSGTIGYVGNSDWLSLVTTVTATITKDPYKRDVRFGDQIIYTDGGFLRTGTIIELSEGASNYTVKLYPRTAIDNGTSATVVRTTNYDVEYYPQFGKSYTVTSYGPSTTPWFGTCTTQAPGAMLEISAGDYDSAFGAVVDTSHFHIGPITLTDGTVLTDKNIFISGSLYNNNPTLPTALTSWNRFASANTSAAPNYNGMYSRFGALVATYPQSFSTPDMLTLQAEASLGSAKIARTIHLPVQPPV